MENGGRWEAVSFVLRLMSSLRRLRTEDCLRTEDLALSLVLCRPSFVLQKNCPTFSILHFTFYILHSTTKRRPFRSAARYLTFREITPRPFSSMALASFCENGVQSQRKSFLALQIPRQKRAASLYAQLYTQSPLPEKALHISVET